jgi:hypothetical protein
LALTTHLTAAERETTVTSTDDDDQVVIWTSRRRHIGELRRNPKFTLRAEGVFGSTAWAEFVIDDSEWSPASGARWRRDLTDEQRAHMAERLHKAVAR